MATLANPVHQFYPCESGINKAPAPHVAGPTPPQRALGGKGKDCTPDGGRHSKDHRLRCHLSILGGNEEAGHAQPMFRRMRPPPVACSIAEAYLRSSKPVTPP
eukprot:scaffold15321_cov116-Isochrysis_galbana.AAC.4